MNDAFYVKVDDRYYAEHADGSAYLTKELERAATFPTRKVARLVAAGLAGASVHRPDFIPGVVDARSPRA